MRLLLWLLFVGYCTIGMAYLPFAYLNVAGNIPIYFLMLLVAGFMGIGTLVHAAGDPEHSRSRTMCRILIAYLLFELLLVIPLAVWLNPAASLFAILNQVAFRFTWLLFPVVLDLCADDRSRRTAGTVVVVAAACLAVWALYSTATGGGAYYLEDGVMRWRVLSLGGGGLLLFAWPFVLAASRAVPSPYTAPLLAVSLVGLILTNSRSGLIAFAIAGFACVAMSGQLGRLLVWAVPAVLIGVVVALAWGQQTLGAFGYTLTHIFDIGSGTGADRLIRYRLAWNFFVTHPFNDYVWSWRFYLTDVSNLYSPHNFALQVAVIEGLAGLIFYGSVLWTSLKGAWSWGRKDAQVRALFGYLMVYLLFSLQNANWYTPVNMVLLVAALAGLVAQVDQLRAAEWSQVPGAHASPVTQAPWDGTQGPFAHK